MASRLQAGIETAQAGHRVVWSLGKLIRDYRQQRDLTQADVARRLQITPQYLCDLELGRRSPSAKILARLAKLVTGAPRG